MSRREKINPWTGQFADAELEAAYQRGVHDRNLRSNIFGVCIGQFSLVAYIFAEYVDSASPTMTVGIRLTAFVIVTLMLLSLRIPKVALNQDRVFVTISIVMGLSLVGIVAVQPSLENTYYIGLIHGFLLMALLLRLQFISMLFAVSILQSSFTIVAFAKGDSLAALLQASNLLMVGVICVAGVYLLQRYQRADFLKNQLIETQNVQLKGLLEAAERDNERKIAALNMLVHFIKTPLHQITGFSDILVNATQDSGGGETAENARYIKKATANLTKSVNGLLTYHRLDEAESGDEPETVSMAAMMEDFSELLVGDVEFSRTKTADLSIRAAPDVLRTALKCLAEHYADPDTGAARVSASTAAEGDRVVLSIRDDGRVLSSAQFEDLVQPLTAIESYLGHTGDEMPMALRTVARAVEIIGGDFSHTTLADGNRYELTLPAAPSQAAAA